jgi:RNA polymerase sigma-70 factor (ECF subfamily)
MTDAQSSELEARAAADLVARIKAGSGAAEAEMVRRYERGLLFLLRRRTRDPDLAGDLCQDTFRIAIEKLRVNPIDEPERLAAYLRGVAMNLVLGHERKRARRATTADSDAVEAAADARKGPFDDVSDAQLSQVIRELLAELSQPRDREILMRLYLDEEDRDVICESLGLEAAHFNRVLFRAKERFRELLTRAQRRGRLKLVDTDTGREGRGNLG